MSHDQILANRDTLPESDSAHTPRISAYGPTALVASEPFNSQPDGNNAAWMMLEESVGAFNVVVNGVTCTSSLDRPQGLLTVSIPPWLSEFAGELHVDVYNSFFESRPAKLRIPVRPRVDAAPPSYEQLQQRYLAVQRALHEFTRHPPPTFAGWGMTTIHRSAWEFGAEGTQFLNLQRELESTFSMTPSTAMTTTYLRQLLWRHWNVVKATKLALKLTAATFEGHTDRRELVECGVGDGITAFWALHACTTLLRASEQAPITPRLWLFDAWEGMTSARVDENAPHLAGMYGDLSISRTRANLAALEKFTVFVPGRIPEVLSTADTPRERVVYLHIDLNHAAATEAALNFFAPQMPRGGVILFDDFGWDAYHETRRVVLHYVENHRGELIVLPTGQALFVVA